MLLFKKRMMNVLNMLYEYFYYFGGVLLIFLRKKDKEGFKEILFLIHFEIK